MLRPSSSRNWGRLAARLAVSCRCVYTASHGCGTGVLRVIPRHAKAPQAHMGVGWTVTHAEWRAGSLMMERLGRTNGYRSGRELRRDFSVAAPQTLKRRR